MSNILFIDPTGEKNLILILFKQKKVYQINKSLKLPLANNLIKNLDQLLKRAKIKPKQINGLAIINGPAAFSSLRAAVTLVNTLAKELKLPVVSLKQNELKKTRNLFALISKKMKKTKRQIILPFYGQEPNITYPQAKP